MLEIEHTGTDSLTITADDNLLPLLNSEVRDGELKLGVKNLTNIQETKKIRYKLTELIDSIFIVCICLICDLKALHEITNLYILMI